MAKSIASRISTDTAFIQDLITGIRKGETKVPQFQRKFVWKDEQALELLDSIANNYPIGSLLLWRTKDKLKAERNIGEFRLPSTDDMSPTDYVLDGQQRLTVIYSCLGAPEDETGFLAVYDLEKDGFVRVTNNDFRTSQFPIRRMFNTTQLLNFRTGLQTHPKSQEYQEKLDALIQSFSNYKIPVVTLKDLTVEEVCPIFERINSSGTKLSTFDLMVAATWTRDFDLNNEVDEICQALESKGFGDIDRNTVLKCFSAVQLGTIKEQFLKTLRDSSKVNMPELVEKTKKSLLKTVDLLSTEFGIYSWEFLSYEAIAVILCYIYSKTNNLSSEQVRRVRQWFWTASFGERYKVGGENFVSKDLNIVKNFVINSDGHAEDFGNLPSEKDWLNVLFRSNASRSSAFILSLASRRPKNITNGLRIDTAEALSIYNKKQFHHVYPRAFLKRTNSKIEDNLVINISMLSAVGNNWISDADPQKYLPELINNLGESADDVFSSNLLPLPSIFEYSVKTYSEFLGERVKIVSDFVIELCKGEK